MTGLILLISPRAAADLQDIWSYIADDVRWGEPETSCGRACALGL